MSSKAPTKIVGGLLAGLLALFAAVVVATPAMAASEPNSVTLTGANAANQFATSLFGSDYAKSGITAANGVVTVPEDYSGTALSDATDFYFQTPIQLVLNNESAITLSNPLVVTGPSTLTVSGSGTISAGESNTYGVFKVGTITGDAPTATSVTSGSLTVNGPVTIQNSSNQNSGTIFVAQGTATLGGGATVTCSSSITGTGAVQVGPASFTGGLGSANLYVNDATITGDCGVSLWNHGGVVVNSGAKITGNGTGYNAESNELCSGAGIAVVAAANDADVNLEVNGGEITGASNGIVTTYSAGGKDSATPTTGTPTADKVTANIDVDGGTITGKGSGNAGFDNNFSNADVSVTGGTFTGTTAFESAATGAQVSGGQFSTPVPTSQLADTVKNMAVLPGAEEDEPSTYGYYGTSVPSEATAVIPIGSASAGQGATVDILAMIINPNTATGTPTVPEGSEPEADAPTAVQAALASYGISASSDLYGSFDSTDLKPNTLYVVYYGDPYQVSSFNLSVTVPGEDPFEVNSEASITGSPNNGFYVAAYTVSATGTCTVTVSGGGGQTDTETIGISGITIYNPATGGSGTLAGTTPVTSYYAQSASAESLNLPKVTTDLSGTASPTVVGWYQLTPVNPAATKVTYNAALYSGTTWAPTAASMTTLMAAYTSLLTSADVTSTLAVSPTNVVNYEGTQATLTVTIKDTAISGESIQLANPTKDGLTIANEDDLETTMADVANGIVQLIGNGKNVISFETYQSTEWKAPTAAPSATLAEDADGKANVTVDGNTVTAVFDVDTTNVTTATSNIAALATISQGSSKLVQGDVSGSATAPTLTQPAALFNVFVGIKAAAQGNGTVEQTVDAQGNVTLSAMPATGATFVGWQYPLGTTLFNTQSITLSQDAIKSLNDNTLTGANATLLAVFQGGTAPTPPTPSGDTIPVYRLYNTATQEHLLTSSANEVADLLKGDWIRDGYDANPSGIAFYALPNSESGVPVYRVYDYGTGTHMYTTSLHEVTVLVNRDGWHWDNGEQPIFTTPTSSSYPVYRLYNGSLPLNVSHLWTASWNEFNTLRNLTGANKWSPEPNESGVAWWSCGVPTGPEV